MHSLSALHTERGISMTSKSKNILVLSITGVIIIVLAVLLIFSGRITMNEENVTGNTPGNLNNGGYFCETEDRVYFANAYDDYTLYSMNPDETDLVKLGDNSVSSINAAGKYLYYSMISKANGSGLGYLMNTYGIYRCNLKGNKTMCLDRSYIVSMQLCGNYLYYQKYDNQKGPSLEKVRIDKKDAKSIAAEIISPNSCKDGVIYYSGSEKDHYLHALDTSTDTSSVVWEANVWNPILQDGYVYYMDIDNNYRLCRYSFTDNVIEVLTDERLDFFNIYDNMIYYQVSSAQSPALKRMLIDGSNPETVKEGVFTNINITSRYVYFNAYEEPTPVYQTSTFGDINVTTFDAAMQAAVDQLKK